MLLEETASIFITPWLLIFVVPKRVDDILRFISDFTIYVDGVGDVCSLSLFDFRRHGNRNYGSPFDAVKNMRSSQGKMEKSFLSFQSVYPSWEPTADGKKFLSNLQKFKERQFRDQILAQCQGMDTSRLTSSARGQGDDIFHRFLPRDIHPSNEVIYPAAYKTGALGLLDGDQRSHPYILDWYYTSHPPHSAPQQGSSPHADEASPEAGEDIWPPLSKPLSEIEEPNWDSSLYERAQSHLEASTSSAFFQHTALKRHDTEQVSSDHWWDKAAPRPTGPPDSFIEPPSFGHQFMAGHHSISHHSDDVSEGNVEELEQSNSRSSSSYWRNTKSLSKTRYIDDSDKEEELSLHFTDVPGKDEDDRHGAADIYGAPLASLPVRIIPRSSDPV